MFFRKKKNPSFNIHHPDIADKIEPSFKAGGIQYYRFKGDVETKMPLGRYKWYFAYLREADLRMSLETLMGYLNLLDGHLKGGKTGTMVTLFDIWKVVQSLKTRVEQVALEPIGVKKLATVTHFDESEDLSGYDKDYNMEKLERWDKHEVMDFFLTKPISDLFGLNNISLESLKTFIKEQQEIISELNSALPNLSSENLSKTGK